MEARMECLADLEFLIPLPQLPDIGVTGVCLQVRLTFLFFLELGAPFHSERAARVFGLRRQEGGSAYPEETVGPR